MKRLAPLIAAVAMIAAACSGSHSPSATTQTTQPQPTQTAATPTGSNQPTDNTQAAGTQTGPAQSPTKVLTIIEENHSYAQMSTGMPYLWSLAQRYGYATHWTAITHPSLPNYLAIAGGSTFGVADDSDPSAHPIDAPTVFDQALDAGKTANLWSESMPANCYLTSESPYGVKHNPWAYFTSSRTSCEKYDVPDSSFLTAAANNALPAAGMLIPNLCNDAHDCSLATADTWLKARLPTVLASDDFVSGRLVVVVTADEDDHSSGNTVLTVVLHPALSSKVVSTALTHYSLTRLFAQVLGVPPLLNGATAPDMMAAFGL